MPSQPLRELVAAACRVLQNEGQEHFNLGHVSAREPGGDRVVVKPSGLGLGEVTANDLVVSDFDGRKVEGELPLHGEMPIHLEIYRRRPDVMCVVHTHPLHVGALSASEARFEMLSQDSILFAKGVGYYPSARLVVTPEQGRALAECLGDLRAVVLKNHGIAIAGRSVQEAAVLALSFDRSVRLQLAAAQLGSLNPISPEEVKAMSDSFERSPGRLESLWEYALRKTASA
jgi:ribulose-5-phosphate 4-epimerase/fuculose-1-phosphate aldolase